MRNVDDTQTDRQTNRSKNITSLTEVINKCAFKISLEGLFYNITLQILQYMYAHKNNDNNNYVSFIGCLQHIFHTMSKVST